MHYASRKSLELFSKEVWWLSAFWMSVSLSKSSEIHIVLLLTKMPFFSLHSVHSVAIYHAITVPETKKKAGLSVKLQPSSVKWLSAFARREMFCSSMSFPPASKKLPFSLSASPGVPLIRRKHEPIHLTCRAGN